LWRDHKFQIFLARLWASGRPRARVRRHGRPATD
jgi:hypothetical protein